ncbi:ABC transporter ATP-binding protein [Reinekea thalattae]|nr:ABC transporter ATP-binding protein [Reinekea thalattae]
MTGEIPEGSITALIGPNGSGKSSLLSLLCGLTLPTEGEILLNEKSLNKIKRSIIAKQIALLPQSNPVPTTLTVSDLVTFGRHPHRPWYKKVAKEDKQVIDWSMNEAGVTAYAERLLTDLSGGELQRAWLAMVLAQDTNILMLDEPTSWLDIAHQVSLLKIVRRLNKQYNKTIVWVLHDLNQARQFSDRAILINNGEIITQGDVNDVINAENITRVYQTSVKMHSLGNRDILWPEEQL